MEVFRHRDTLFVQSNLSLTFKKIHDAKIGYKSVTLPLGLQSFLLFKDNKIETKVLFCPSSSVLSRRKTSIFPPANMSLVTPLTAVCSFRLQKRSQRVLLSSYTIQNR